MNATLSTQADWLAKSTRRLEKAGIPTARLDCLVLLEDTTGRDRSWLLAHPETPLQGLPLLKDLEQMLERRAKHEPLAYIRGKTEFYGREFLVSPDTLEPRPETETMIELLLNQFKSQKSKVKSVVDVGTGSGCLAITTKLELPECEVVGVDISKKCLEIARKNAKRLKADVKFYQGNLLEPVIAHCSLLTALLCNLPYVPDAHTINQAAMQEPKLAIFGGEDGLDLYRKLFSQLRKTTPRFVLTESLPFQHDELAKIAAVAGYRLVETNDFIQLFSL